MAISIRQNAQANSSFNIVKIIPVHQSNQSTEHHPNQHIITVHLLTSINSTNIATNESDIPSALKDQQHPILPPSRSKTIYLPP